MQQPPIVAIPDHADLGRDPFLDIDGIAIPELLGAVERQVRLPLDLIDPAQHLATGLVGHLDELVPFDRLHDRAAERRRAYVAVDDANKSVAVVGRGPRMSGGIHPCIPCVAR